MIQIVFTMSFYLNLGFDSELKVRIWIGEFESGFEEYKFAYQS